MELPDLALGALATVIRCLSYDALDWKGVYVMVSAIMKTAGVYSDPCSVEFQSALSDCFRNGTSFDMYYKKINHGVLCSKEDHKTEMRLIGVLVCLDLTKDLSLLTNLDHYNFIFVDFLAHHQQPFCVETFDQIRAHLFYQVYKKALAILALDRAIFLRKLDLSNAEQPTRFL